MVLVLEAEVQELRRRLKIKDTELQWAKEKLTELAVDYIALKQEQK